MNGKARHRNDSAFVIFGVLDDDVTLGEVDVGESESHSFPGAEAGAVDQFEDRAVANPFRSAEVTEGEPFFDGCRRKWPGQAFFGMNLV